MAWLRGEVKEAIESLDRGEGIYFESAGEMTRYFRKLTEEAIARHARKNGKKSA